MKTKGKHAQRKKTIYNLALNGKKILKHGLLRVYHRLLLHELLECTIGYIVVVFTPPKCSQLLYKLIFCWCLPIPFK